MEQDKIIRDAQYRKGLSIAFFNATNAAVELVKLEAELGVKPIAGKKNKKGGKKKPPTWEERLEYWRGYLLERHKEYYSEVIAGVGVNYKANESIEKIKKAKNLEELQGAWRMLSEDERADGEIRAVVQELKKKYTNAKT